MSRSTGSRHDDATPSSPPRPRRRQSPRSRTRRVLKAVALVLFAVVVLVATGFFVWAKTPMSATASSLAAVADDPRVDVVDRPDVVVMRPARTTALDQGLVFVAGARVDPQAYEQVLAGLVATGVTVVVERPVLGFGILDPRPLEHFTSLAPEVTNWAVGGHSLGGVRACQYAADDPAVDGLVLFGSYCATTDLSGRDDLPVLSLGGGADGLSTPDDIERYRDMLPADATVVEIPGLAHAQFGSYGVQPGDGEPSISDEEARARINRELTSFFAGVGD
ncbi:alpha/beta hydrolase [Frigoribacterium sp. PvP032]|uniref:alpha/beta hydrolase n=1 Tax=Frigoribacterium sp. PvP032 TaxID=2806589 RepID=UPI001B4202CA|nr:alpha/beta hydrolase [Frigoribacterium sp. PvP032]MBP1190314.1 putative alpha/beta-hydrolase family hydrolase [Frigoribacterium sp. PvP032]